jgi:hypothetical protein
LEKANRQAEILHAGNLSFDVSQDSSANTELTVQIDAET